MQNNILVSVVVPVYNVEKYLSRCIDSISRQSYSNLQIILVDDGSKDNSAVICDEYSKKDTRISVIHKTNGGLSDARNVGIDNAKGDYICFIDSDDFVRETYVEDLLNAILKYNADIAVCLFEKGNSDKFNDVVENKQQNEIILNNIGAVDKLYDEVLNVSMVVAWNKLYSKNLFYKIRFPVGKVHEDEFTTPKLLFGANKIVIINKKDYYYFQSPNSIMRSEFNINRFDALLALENRMQFFQSSGLDDLYNKTVYSYFNLIFNFIDIINEQNIDKKYKLFLCNKAKNIMKIIMMNKFFKFKLRFFALIFCLFPNLALFMREKYLNKQRCKNVY